MKLRGILIHFQVHTGRESNQKSCATSPVRIFSFFSFLGLEGLGNNVKPRLQSALSDRLLLLSSYRVLTAIVHDDVRGRWYMHDLTSVPLLTKRT